MARPDGGIMNRKASARPRLFLMRLALRSSSSVPSPRARIRHPCRLVAVVFEARRRFERILGGVHRQVDLVVLHRCFDGIEADGNVLFAGAKEAADADD